MLNLGIFSCDKKRCLTCIVLLLCSSFLWDLSFLRRETSWVISIAFVPALIIVRKRLLNSFNSFWAGWLLGFIFFIFNLYWLKFIGVIPWILLALLQGLFIGLWMFIISFKSDKLYSNSWRQILIPPLAWVIIEWLRAQGHFGMEWGGPAYSQHANLFIVQWASIIGPYGVSGLILLMNTLIAGISECCFGTKQFFIKVSVVILTTAIITMVGNFLFSKKTEQESTLRVALLQPSISQNEKWDKNNFNRHMLRFESMVIEAKQRGAELVIFPETAIPDYLLLSQEISNTVAKWAIDNKISLAVGGIDKEGANEWNTLFFIDKNGVMKGRYHKQHLVPFGEYIPFPFQALKGKIPILDLVGDYKRGNESPIFHTKELLWSVLICFESTMPSLARQAVKKGAKFIVVATNDAWFERSRAPFMHAAMGIFRGVENGVSFVQAANTGVSIIASPRGEVIAKADLFQSVVIVGGITKPLPRTIYNIFGDWIVFFSVIVLAVYYKVLAFKK